MTTVDNPTFWQWLVTTNDIKSLWAAQPTYIISQALYLFAGLVTFIHAFRKGGRWPYFWFATVLHGLYSDNFWHLLLPEYDNFWHSQTPVMFFGARLPLHIIILYPAFIYHAAYAVHKLNLPSYAEPFAVGLAAVLIDIPYDIVAVKFVHWTWHDTDPNIFDRHYWVPWSSYYFHATFAASLYFFFHSTRKWMAPKVAPWSAASTWVELKSLIIATALGMPGGVLLFIPIYHSLHDIYKIHSEVTYFLIFTIYLVIIWFGLLNRNNSNREQNKEKLSGIDYVMLFQLFLHYSYYWLLTVFGSPEKERSLGFHEPVGPCDEKASLVTPFGQTLFKRKYFCAQDYDEAYFNFNCPGAKVPSHGTNWYLICGTPFENRAEYVTVLSTLCIVAFGFFYGSYFKTSKAVTPVKEKKRQ